MHFWYYGIYIIGALTAGRLGYKRDKERRERQRGNRVEGKSLKEQTKQKKKESLEEKDGPGNNKKGKLIFGVERSLGLLEQNKTMKEDLGTRERERNHTLDRGRGKQRDQEIGLKERCGGEMEK